MERLLLDCVCHLPPRPSCVFPLSSLLINFLEPGTDYPSLSLPSNVPEVDKQVQKNNRHTFIVLIFGWTSLVDLYSVPVFGAYFLLNMFVNHIFNQLFLSLYLQIWR